MLFRAIPYCILCSMALDAVAQADPPEPGHGALIPGIDWLPWVPVEEGDPGPFTAPGEMDLSPIFPPAGDQHRQYACVAWAWAYAVQSALDNAAAGRTYARTDTADRASTYSPAYIFNEYKQITESSPACTSGVDFNDQIALALNMGNSTLLEMPYDTTDQGCLNIVPASVITAAQHRAEEDPIAAPVMIGKRNSGQWVAHLASGEPLMVFFVVGDNSFNKAGFTAYQERRPFRWTGSNGNDASLTGHSVTCTGYRILDTLNRTDTLFTFLNSFGPHWGDTGYFSAGTDMLKYFCYAAFAFAPRDTLLDSIPDMIVPDTVPFAKPSKLIKLKVGHRATGAGLSVYFIRTDRSDKSSSIAILQRRTARKPLLITLKRGRAITIYQGGRRIRCTLRIAHGPFQRLMGARLLVETVPDNTTDEFREDQLRTFARLRTLVRD